MPNRKILDALLMLLFFGGLSSTFLTEKMHELLGLIFVAGIIVHNFINRSFYKNFLRGKFSALRLINNLCATVLISSVAILTASGVMLWLNLAPATNWRAIHLGAAITLTVALLIHWTIHARRYAQGKIFYAASIAAFVLAVAGIFGLPYLDRWYHKVEVNRAEIIHGEKIPTGKKILTVYFSRVGNTNFPKGVDAVSGASVILDGEEIFGNAQMIALMANDAVGGDLFALQTEKIYPASYSETTQVAKQEFAANELPPLKNLPATENYDAVILVHPLWWGTLPKPVENFLLNCDLRGKILIPIVTHGGGGIGESLDAIKRATNAEIIHEPLDIYSSDIPTSRNEIGDYLRKFFR